MKNFYEVGKVYIWQNLVGDDAFLNGRETTVTGPLEYCIRKQTGEALIGQPTDTPHPCSPGKVCYAVQGWLRPKNPPSGERGISELFNLPEEVAA